jgi:ATP-dependent DNA ligase
MLGVRAGDGFTLHGDTLFKQFRRWRSRSVHSRTCRRARADAGARLTAEKMKECRWLKPVLVDQVKFVERTPDKRLRHSRFVAFREDRDVCAVRRKA